MAAIQARNFQSNSLSGVVSISNGFANLALLTNPFALEGNKSFVIKLRRGSILGDVVATSPAITLQDNSSFVSLTANTSSVNEGNLVSFTLVTANAVNGSTLFYSVSPVTGNLTISDFYNGSNTGYITLNNNQATFALYANTDSGYVDETGETFRVQIRSDSITGNVVYASTSNVAIVDSYKLYNIISIVESTNPVMEYGSISFTITGHNIPTGTLLYYSIGGNVGTFASGNTGSFSMNSTSNVLTLTMPSIPSQQSRVLTLDVRKDSPTGQILRSSNTITVIDAALAYNSISGGTEFNIGDGYKTHVFTTSANLTISSVGTQYSSINYLVVAGGGGGGGGSGFNSLGGGGGGAGGYIGGNLTLSSTGIVPIIIGAGGSGGPGGNAFGVNGSNTILSGGINLTAVGGGYGAADQLDGRPGGNGGSGGGSIYSSGTTGQGYPGQGFPGGMFGNPVRVGGSGGGAGAASPMFNPGGLTNGPGGIGKVFEGSPPAYGTPGPTSGQWFAGGGGGGNSPAQPGGTRTGGSGGGGDGAPTGAPATPGTPNTGGGGGGGNSGVAGGGGGPGIVIIRYPYNVATYTNVVYPAGFSTISTTSNITFTLNALNANLQTLYYTTEGNVTTSDFIGGNTGSFVANASGAVFTLRANAIVAATSTKQFALQIRDGSTSGDVVATSSNVTIAGLNLYYIQATGGDTVYLTSDGYKVHTYNSSSTFNVTSFGASTIEYLVLAGGGAGGAGFPGFNGVAAGGGAGGYLEGSAVLPSTGAYIVTVGAGAAPSTGAARGSNGSNSNIFNPGLSIVALGGGGGGGGNMGSSFPGNPGGSGGGANSNGSAGSGTPGQGYSGGVGYDNNSYGGGGGGAGGAAQNGAPTSYSSTGGPGATSSITGTSVVRGGGGTGGRAPNAGSASPPAGGGGGAGGWPAGPGPTSGTVNSGGGGGGAVSQGGGSGGGSGIVIIRYPFGLPYFTGLTISSLSSNVITVGSNITFDLAVQGANTRTFYYTTEGNVTASNFIGGNTGSFVANTTGAVITLQANTNIPLNESRYFALQIRQGSTTDSISAASANVTINGYASQILATGGTIATAGGYRTHTFNDSGTLTITKTPQTQENVEILMVAGGGGRGGNFPGSSTAGGGGGGGGVLYRANATLAAQSYSIVIGGGGGATGGGTPTTGFSVIAAGGGAGGNNAQYGPGAQGGYPGGNGGGGGQPGGSGGSSTQNSYGGWFKYGNAGEPASGDQAGGPGGSAGATFSISGSPVTYGGGGASTRYQPAPAVAPGTGNGGWGSRGDSPNYPTNISDGSPGVVIVRYPYV